MPHVYIYLNRLFPANWLDKEWAKVERENIFKRMKKVLYSAIRRTTNKQKQWKQEKLKSIK